LVWPEKLPLRPHPVRQPFPDQALRKPGMARAESLGKPFIPVKPSPGSDRGGHGSTARRFPWPLLRRLQRRAEGHQLASSPAHPGKPLVFRSSCLDRRCRDRRRLPHRQPPTSVPSVAGVVWIHACGPMLPFGVGFFGVTLVVLMIWTVGGGIWLACSKTYCPAFEVSLPRVVCGMIWSAVLVQVKGSQRSFQPSMKLPIAAMRSLTEVKVPRRMAWRVMIPRSG
jgi:hypothetical protein